LPTVSVTFAEFFMASKVSQLKISISSIGSHKKKYQLLINCQEEKWKKLKKISGSDLSNFNDFNFFLPFSY
jgi:hypothetical protein